MRETQQVHRDRLNPGIPEARCALGQQREGPSKGRSRSGQGMRVGGLGRSRRLIFCAADETGRKIEARQRRCAEEGVVCESRTALSEVLHYCVQSVVCASAVLHDRQKYDGPRVCLI